jgi:glutamine synthetase
MKKSSTNTHGHYLKGSFDQHGKVIAEYIWIDGSGTNVRSKSRTLDSRPESVEAFPEWNYDGSSTMQATTGDSEVILRPVSFYNDPFRGGDNVLVLCATYRKHLTTGELYPVNTNFRHHSEEIFKAVESHRPWFGIEQEYTLFSKMDVLSKTPLGWPAGGYPVAQGKYYCGIGTDVSYARAVIDQHYKACLTAGLEISGVNNEDMPGQYEFQIGPCGGLDSGDQLWIARYILARVTEDFGIGLSFEPKPIKGDWSGSGGHVNFSTVEMREEGGYEHIKSAITKLSENHTKHISMYGAGNHLRLSGKNQTCDVDEFKAGVGDRSASVRIPSDTHIHKKGYFEDRRPASNLDPYLVGSLMCSTILLEGKGYDALYEHHEKWIEEMKE